MNARPLRDQAEGVSIIERGDASAGERSPANLHEKTIDHRAGGEELRDDLPAKRLTSFNHQPVLVSLTGERQCTRRYRFTEAVIGRITRHARLPRTTRDMRAERLQSCNHSFRGVGR